MVSITGLLRQTYSADRVWCGEAVFGPTEVRLLKRVLGQGPPLSLSAQAITPHVLSLMWQLWVAIIKKIRDHNCKMDAPCVFVGEACDPNQWFSSFCWVTEALHCSLQAFLFRIRCMIQIHTFSENGQDGSFSAPAGREEKLSITTLCNRKNCAQRLTLDSTQCGWRWNQLDLKPLNKQLSSESSLFFFQFHY